VALAAPVTLAELRARLARVTSLTATFSRDEARDAMNYGYAKVLRAIQSVDPHHFVAFRDNFTFSGGETIPKKGGPRRELMKFTGISSFLEVPGNVVVEGRRSGRVCLSSP